jgi:hypothetical protein
MSESGESSGHDAARSQDQETLQPSIESDRQSGPSTRKGKGKRPQPRNLKQQLADSQAENQRLNQRLLAIEARLTSMQPSPSPIPPAAPEIPVVTLDPTTLRQLSRSMSRDYPQRSKENTKIAKFDNTDEGPSYEVWEFEVRTKFEENPDHFPSENSRISFIFNRTDKTPKEFLLPRVKHTSPMRYTSIEEVFQDLRNNYADPFEAQTARAEYKDLVMSERETFPEFKSKFLLLAVKGEIPASNYLEDIWLKLPIPLRRRLATEKQRLTSFSLLCTYVQGVDQELRRLNLEQQREKATHLTASSRQPLAKPKATMPSIPKEVHFSPAPNTTRSGPILPRSFTPKPSPPIASTPTALTCFRCKQPGHLANACPNPPAASGGIHEIEEVVEDEELQESSDSDAELSGNGEA